MHITITSNSLKPVVGEPVVRHTARTNELKGVLIAVFTIMATEPTHRMVDAIVNIEENKARAARKAARAARVQARIEAELEAKKAIKKAHEERMGKSHAVRCGDRVWSKN